MVVGSATGQAGKVLWISKRTRPGIWGNLPSGGWERRAEIFRRVASFEVLHSSRAEAVPRQGRDRRQAVPPPSSRDHRAPRLTFLPPRRLRPGHSFQQAARPLVVEAHSVRFPTLLLLGAVARSGPSRVRSLRSTRRRTLHLSRKPRR